MLKCHFILFRLFLFLFIKFLIIKTLLGFTPDIWTIKIVIVSVYWKFEWALCKYSWSFWYRHLSAGLSTKGILDKSFYILQIIHYLESFLGNLLSPECQIQDTVWRMIISETFWLVRVINEYSLLMSQTWPQKNTRVCKKNIVSDTVNYSRDHFTAFQITPLGKHLVYCITSKDQFWHFLTIHVERDDVFVSTLNTSAGKVASCIL